MLGDRIRLLRCRQGISQTELANRLHISPSTIGMYEQGRREPSLDTVVSLAQEFGVTTDYLLTGNCACPQDADLGAQALNHILREVQCCVRTLFPELAGRHDAAAPLLK